jgi:hypothetical protein
VAAHQLEQAIEVERFLEEGGAAKVGRPSFERQQFRHHLTQVGVVFDDQNRAVTGEAWTGRMRESSRLRRQAL